MTLARTVARKHGAAVSNNQSVFVNDLDYKPGLNVGRHRKTAMQPETTRLGITAILSGGIAVGFAAIFMRLSPVDPSAAAFWRVAISAPVFLILAFLTPKRRQQVSSLSASQLKLILYVGIWFAVDLFFWHWAVARTTVANATLLANLASVFAVVAGYFLHDERVSKRFLTGLVLALFGAVALVGQNLAFSPDYLFGDFLGLVTSFALTGYMVAAAQARGSVPTMILMAGSATVSAILLLPVGLLAAGPFAPSTIEGWFPLLGLALVTHVTGQGLIIYGLAHISAAAGSIGLLIQPVIAAVLGWAIFAEALGPLHLVGGLLILGGIWWSQRQ